MRRSVIAMLALVLLVVLAACDGDGDESADRPPPTSEPDADEDRDEDTADEGTADDEGGSAPDTGAADDDLPVDQPLDVRVDHPGGVQLRVTSLAFERDHVAIGLVVTNGTNILVLLSGNNLSDPMVLEDDRDTTYRFVPPEDDPATGYSEKFVPVNAASTLEGTFVFAGRVHPEATEFTLTVNPESDETEPSSSVFYPRMVVEIPIGIRER
jgi:hypothetical protein